MPFRERVIKALNERFCGKEANVQFESDSLGRLISIGSEEAINSFDNDRERVFATPWFKDYWFFIRIQISPRDDEKIYISVSFFQKTDGFIKQLFRAEWDNYPPKEKYSHPQPHWHFTAQLSDNPNFGDLDTMEEEGDFGKLEGSTQSINLHRMHFAMVGDWVSSGQMINSLNDETVIVDWLIRLFVHVRKELEYKD